MAILGPTLALAALVTASAAAAIDLSGKWRVEYEDGSAEFVDVTDAAGAVSLTLEFLPSRFDVPTAFTGTFSDPTLALTIVGCPTCPLHAAVLFGGDYFDGRLLTAQFQVHRVLANRCECFDGNTTDGDGCDATCRVEPCFSCTGMPSSCSPTPDGGSCSDASPCTTAETCTAGVCSGTPVTPCVDLSGVWDTTTESDFFETVESVARIEQRDTIVLFRDDATGAPRHFGSIVPSTGAFTLELPSLNLAFCIDPDPMSGTADLDAQSYDASGWFDAVVPPVCVALVFTQTGTRQCPGVGCPPPPNAPAIPPLGGVSLGILLVFATWFLRRRLA